MCRAACNLSFIPPKQNIPTTPTEKLINWLRDSNLDIYVLFKESYAYVHVFYL